MRPKILQPVKIAICSERVKVSPIELEDKIRRELSALALDLEGEGMAWTYRMT